MVECILLISTAYCIKCAAELSVVSTMDVNSIPAWMDLIKIGHGYQVSRLDLSSMA